MVVPLAASTKSSNIVDDGREERGGGEEKGDPAGVYGRRGRVVIDAVRDTRENGGRDLAMQIAADDQTTWGPPVSPPWRHRNTHDISRWRRRERENGRRP